MLEPHAAGPYPSVVQIRVATGEDSLGIETVRVRGWQSAYRNVFPAEELDRMPIDHTRWRTRLDDPPAGWTTLVAVDDARVIGFASVGPSRDELGVGELYAIYVDPEHWSAGVGLSLLERGEAILIQTFAEATLWVLADNPRARAFYERGGWSPDGTVKHEAWWGVRAEEVRYRKRLRQ